MVYGLTSPRLHTMTLIDPLFATTLRGWIPGFHKMLHVAAFAPITEAIRMVIPLHPRRDCSQTHALKHQKQVFGTGYMLNCCVDTHRLFVGFLSIDAFVTMASWPLIPRQASAPLLETV